MPLLTLNLLSAAGLMARRAWIHHVDTQGLYGSDHHMVSWAADNDTRAWCMFSVHFDATPGADWDALRDQIAEAIAADLKHPDSDFRRGVDLRSRHYVWHRHLRMDDLIEHVEDDEHFFRVADPLHKRELVLRFHRHRPEMAVLFDHTVWDGARVVNEILTPAISSKPFASRWLLPDIYRPVMSEALQLYTAWRMAGRRLRHRPMPTLPEGADLTVFDHRFKTAEVKALKNEAGVGFAPAMVATWAHKLFSWSDPTRTKIRFGVLVATSSTRHRNNYSIVLVDLFREHDLITAARSVNQQMKRRGIEVVPLYQLLNNVDMQSMFKREIVDCLFSPAPFERDTGPSTRVDTMSFFAVPSTCPLYGFACTIDDEIAVSTTYNTPEIHHAAMAAEAHRVIGYTDRGHVTYVDTPQQAVALPRSA